MKATARTPEARTEETVRAERRKVVWELRRAGKSFREIAEMVKAPTMTVYDDYKWNLLDRKATPEDAEEQRQLELARYDRYLAALEVRIDGPPCEVCGAGTIDVKAIDAATKVSKARRELKGLDAPTKTQEVPAEPLPDAELAGKLEEALATVKQRLAESKEARH